MDCAVTPPVEVRLYPKDGHWVGWVPLINLHAHGSTFEDAAKNVSDELKKLVDLCRLTGSSLADIAAENYKMLRLEKSE